MIEMSLDVGARIRFRDGRGGTLHKLVVDPRTKQVTDLVIMRGFLQRHDYVIPISVVDNVTPDEIEIALYSEELESYPHYREIEFVQPIVDEWDSEASHPREHVVVWYPLAGFYERDSRVIPALRRRIPEGIPMNEEVIGRSSVVRNIDGIVGKIDHLWLDRESWQITHLIVRKGIVPHYVVVPFSWISSITPGEVYIWGSGEQLKEIPFSQLAMGPSQIAGEADAGEGGIPLDDNLAIAQQLTDALAEDPRTSTSVVEVVYERGVVTLLGAVRSEIAHAAAEEIAHRHPSVSSVVNALEVRPRPDFVESIAGRLWTNGGANVWRRS